MSCNLNLSPLDPLDASRSTWRNAWMRYIHYTYSQQFRMIFSVLHRRGPLEVGTFIEMVFLAFSPSIDPIQYRLDCFHCFHPGIFFYFSLKELYTSQTTLAQKTVLTPLNNKVRLKKVIFDLLHAKKSARIFEQNPQIKIENFVYIHKNH